MLYRTMPKNGDSLSILGFGCMRLPVKDQHIDEAAAISLIRFAADQGVNYFDTAWPYHAGESEVLLGKALLGGYRDRVKLATKLPSWMIKSRADMDRYLNAQLKKLQTDHIDYYLLHALDGSQWDNLVQMGVVDFIDKAKKDGRIINIGFSFHGLPADFIRIVDAYPWVFCQIQYNYLDEDYQAGTQGLRHAGAKGIGVIVMEPLRGGNLASSPQPSRIEEIWNRAKVRRTPVDWALSWVWNNPEVTVVLSGMSALDQVKENLAIASSAKANTLTAEELQMVADVSQTYRQLMKVGCTGCGYCMPCPSGVAIPRCFEEYNKMHLFGKIDEARFRYAFGLSGDLGTGEPSFASQCVQCGECLDKCPQHIPIPDMLEHVVKEMEGPDLMQRIEIARTIFRIEA